MPLSERPTLPAGCWTAQTSGMRHGHLAEHLRGTCSPRVPYPDCLALTPALIVFRKRHDAGSSVQRLNRAAPLCCTSRTLRVARYMSYSSAVAASIVSITGGVCPVARLTAPLIAPQRRTTASLTGNSRPANRASSAASAPSIRGRTALSSGRLCSPGVHAHRAVRVGQLRHHVGVQQPVERLTAGTLNGTGVPLATY